MINIKRNISRNKKGEDTLVDFWAILLFVVILILFLVLFIFTKDDAEENELRDQLVRTDTSYMMNAYLKSPSLVDGSKNNGKILADDVLNNDFKRTENSFKAFFTGINTTNAAMEDDMIKHYSIIAIKLCIYDSSDSFITGYKLTMKTKTVSSLFLMCDTTGSIAKAKTSIPTRDSFIYVETVLYGIKK